MCRTPMKPKSVLPIISVSAERLQALSQSKLSGVRALHHKASYRGPTKRRGGHTKKTKKGDNWTVRPKAKTPIPILFQHCQRREPLSCHDMYKNLSPKVMPSFEILQKPMNNYLVSNSTMVMQLRQCQQVRGLSSEIHYTDEDEFDSMLHERELEMHRHPSGPVPIISDLARKALKGKGYDSQMKDVKMLDIESQPYDSMVTLAKEFPDASIYSIGNSIEAVRSMADGMLKLGVPNITTQQFNASDLSAFEDASFDLVTSCYGLQKSRDPQNLINEIHR